MIFLSVCLYACLASNKPQNGGFKQANFFLWQPHDSKEGWKILLGKKVNNEKWRLTKQPLKSRMEYIFIKNIPLVPDNGCLPQPYSANQL